ncbi:MAG TPA: hypothetical protein VHL53_00985, partial [Acidimicrobiia bacterium]|nr:hypothetical protein [Acidimicrobiia bacterium]
MNRRVRAAAVAILATTAGCGIPRDSQPTVLPGGVVNTGFPRPPTTTPSPVPTLVSVRIYLAKAEQLVTVVRTAPSADLMSALTLLLAGPTPDEYAAGIRSAITPQTALRSARL